MTSVRGGLTSGRVKVREHGRAGQRGGAEAESQRGTADETRVDETRVDETRADGATATRRVTERHSAPGVG